MRKKRFLTAVLVLAAILFIFGKAMRNAMLPHVKTAVVGSGSIVYTFPGWQAQETFDGWYLIETDEVYAECFSVGETLRWVPYSDSEIPQNPRIIAVETSDNTCFVTFEPLSKDSNIQDGSIQVDSPFYLALVPPAAFVSEDTVYVVLKDITTGSSNYIVDTCKVQTGPGNGQYIPCLSGIAHGANVLVAWDRPLTINGEVEVVGMTVTK